MDDYVSRLKQEHIDLAEKVFKLRDFLGDSEKLISISEDQKSDLDAQLLYMEGYLRVLATRLGKIGKDL